MEYSKEKTVLAHILHDPTIRIELDLKAEMFSDMGKVIWKHTENYQVNEGVLLAECEQWIGEYVDLMNHLDLNSTLLVAKMMVEEYNRSLHLKASYKHYNRLTEGKLEPQESLAILNSDIEAGIVAKADNMKGRVEQVRNLRDTFGKPATNPLYAGIESWESEVGPILPNKLQFTGAKPGTGKTQFALEQIYHLACEGTPCLFFSLEMSTDICNLRLLAIHLRLPFHKLELAYYGSKELPSTIMNSITEGFNFIADLPIIIVEDVYYISEIKTQAKNYHRKYDIKYMCIDYAQLIRTSGSHDRNDLKNTYISAELAQLKKEVCTVNVLSQMSASGLKDGGWDQDADDIFVLSRDNSDIEDLIEYEFEKDDILKYGMVAKVLKCRSNGTAAGKSFLNIFNNGRYAKTNVPF
jgi:hypothetical protein